MRLIKRLDNRASHGAALVELAMVLPLVVMLIVGMVSAGVAYNHQLALTHAAREGGRYAATLPVTNFSSEPDPMAAWLAEVINQTIEDATGSLNAGVPDRYVCVAYVSPGSISTDQTTRRILNSSGLQAAQPGEDCLPVDGTLNGTIDDGRPAEERRVQVVVSRSADFNALVFSSTLTLDSVAVNRFEAGVGLS